jgi:hypothetical protein
MEFRLLNKDEVECRVERVTSDGATVLIYKNARVDQDILDETVGPENWQRRHPLGPQTCVISIWDPAKNQWVEKEDMGGSSFEKGFEKGAASDSFKRAGFNWGIGRELYTCPKMFIPKEILFGFNEKDSKVYDRITVSELVSEVGDKKKITSITLAISYKNAVHHTIKFPGGEITEIASDVKSDSASAVIKVEAPIEESPKETSVASVISDDTVILIGNCKGKKYGEVKDTDTFKNFLQWVEKSNTSYPDPDKDAQFKLFKSITQKG